MRHLIFGLGILFSFGGLSQDVSRFVEKTVGEGYVQLPKNLAATKDSVLPVYSRCAEDVVIGHVFKGEYVLHDDSLKTVKSKGTFIGTNYISKAEFIAFRDWIRDSIAREHIYYGLESDEDAIEYIDYAERSKEFAKQGFIFEQSHRQLNREIFHLNWDKKFQYDDPGLVPILAYMYLPMPERLRRLKEFDRRRFWYRSDYWNPSKFGFPIFIDSYNFARASKHPFDVWSVYTFLNEQLDLDRPITHIEPFMAELYCEWKSKQINRELSEKNADYRVEMRLPTKNEAVSVISKESAATEIPAYDFTENWKITNQEYHTFSAFVLDSATRTFLYFTLKEDVEANRLLICPDFYYGEGYYEYAEWEPSDREINYELGHLNFTSKIRWDKVPDVSLNELNKRVGNGIEYVYSWLDVPAMSLDGESFKEIKYADFYNGIIKSRWYVIKSNEVFNGKNCLMSTSIGYGLRCHINYQRFIHRERIVIPHPDQLVQNEQIADISYEQALAFYNWKFRIDKYKEDETGDWQQFVFPTEAEFKRIKNGERIVHPATSIAYDFPVFRMVLEVVSK